MAITFNSRHTIKSAFLFCLLLTCTATPARSEDNACSAFDALFPDNPQFPTISAITGEDRRANLTVGTYFTNTGRTELYATSIIKLADKAYEGVIKLFPDQRFMAIAPYEFGGKKAPPEISAITSTLKIIRREEWKGGNALKKIMPTLQDDCKPLAGYIAAEQFADGNPHIFVRHFPFGKRQQITHYCRDNSNYKILFYSSFTPYRFDLAGHTVYIDNQYMGVGTGQQFTYPCGLATFVQGRDVILDASDLGSLPTGTSGNHNATWEDDVKANISDGQSIFNK